MSPSSLRAAASSVSSSLPGELELELASDDGGDDDAAATTALRAADELLRGHLAVAGRRRIPTAVRTGTGAGELTPTDCILSRPREKPNRIGSSNQNGNLSSAARRIDKTIDRRDFLWGRAAFSSVGAGLKLAAVLSPHFCGSVQSPTQENPSPDILRLIPAD